MLVWPTLHDLITDTTNHDQRRNQGECFGPKKIKTFCYCFRVIYNQNFNFRLHPLNERAIGATLLKMIFRNIDFHIPQKKFRSQVYFWLGPTVPKSIYQDMAAMTAEQWQFCQLVAKALHETADIDRMWQRASVCLAFQDQPRRMTANEVLHLQDFPDVTLVFKDDRLSGGISLH